MINANTDILRNNNKVILQEQIQLPEKLEVIQDITMSIPKHVTQRRRISDILNSQQSVDNSQKGLTSISNEMSNSTAIAFQTVSKTNPFLEQYKDKENLVRSKPAFDGNQPKTSESLRVNIIQDRKSEQNAVLPVRTQVKLSDRSKASSRQHQNLTNLTTAGMKDEFFPYETFVPQNQETHTPDYEYSFKKQKSKEQICLPEMTSKKHFHAPSSAKKEKTLIIGMQGSRSRQKLSHHHSVRLSSESEKTNDERTLRTSKLEVSQEPKPKQKISLGSDASLPLEKESKRQRQKQRKQEKLSRAAAETGSVDKAQEGTAASEKYEKKTRRRRHDKNAALISRVETPAISGQGEEQIEKESSKKRRKFILKRKQLIAKRAAKSENEHIPQQHRERRHRRTNESSKKRKELDQEEKLEKIEEVIVETSQKSPSFRIVKGDQLSTQENMFSSKQQQSFCGPHNECQNKTDTKQPQSRENQSSHTVYAETTNRQQQKDLQILQKCFHRSRERMQQNYEGSVFLNNKDGSSSPTARTSQI